MEHDDAKKRRKQYPSVHQKARLINLLEADAELRGGKFSASFTKKVGVERWKKISDEVNAIPGALKTWEEWRKTWQDMKSKVKKKQAEVRRSSNLTGGGSPAEQLTDQDNQVLATISESVLIGHQDSKESKVVLYDIPTPDTAACIAPLLAQTERIDSSTLFIDDIYAAGPSTSTQKLQIDSPPATEAATCDPPTIEILEDEQNVHSTKPAKKTTNNTVQKRFQSSLKVASELNKNLKEKNEFKKEFYEQYILEMRKQSEALSLIARSMAVRTNPYI